MYLSARAVQIVLATLLGAVLVGGFGISADGAVIVTIAPRPQDPTTVPGYDQDPLSLLGPSRVDAVHLAGFVQRHSPRTTVPIEALAQIYLEEGAAYGVRADLAWAQSIIETGFFHFPDRGMVRPADNNFAGIGACDSCHTGNGYPDARTGVRAQMQLLRGYGDPNTLANAMIHPPQSYRGSAPTWWQMGNGHWATSPVYAHSVITMYASLLKFSGIDLAYVPPAPLIGAGMTDGSVAGSDALAPPEPPVRVGDGLYLVDPNGQVYDIGDTRFWGSPYVESPDSTATLSTSPPVNTIAMTPHANGYWLFSASGTVLRYGDAPALGRAPRNVVAVAAQPHGYGYWTVDRNGSVESFGDAPQLVAPTGLTPGARVVAIAPTRTGQGYWLIDSIGRVVAAGDATSFGNATHITTADPIVGIAPTPWDDGYWTTTSAGSVLAFGKATDHGGLASEFSDDADRAKYPSRQQRDYFGLIEADKHLVTAVRPSPSGDGYWLITADGLVVGRGDAPDFAQTDTQGSPIMSAASRLDVAPPLRP